MSAPAASFACIGPRATLVVMPKTPLADGHDADQAAGPDSGHGHDHRHVHGEHCSHGQPRTPLTVEKVGRNDPCPCNSGKKYKKCCGARR